MRRLRRVSGFCLTVVTAAAVGCSPIRTPTFPPAPADVVGRPLSRADAVDDLDMLMRTLEDVHPNPYAVRSRDSVTADRTRLVANLPVSMSRGEWWIRLAPLVASLGDGHTNVSYPGEDVVREQRAGALVFPPSVAMNDEGHIVVVFPFGQSSGLARDNRILAVNGHDADSLVASWVTELSGESESFRTTSVTDSFRDLLLLHGFRAPFVIKYVAGAGEREVTIPGLAIDSLASAVRGAQARGGRGGGGRGSVASPNFSYRAIDRGVGYMNFRSMSGDLSRFRDDIATMFRQVAADSDHALVIDLRSNGGGDSRLGDAMLRYFATAPYRNTSVKQWKMSAQYRAYVNSFVRPPLGLLPVWYLHPMGRRMFRGPDGTIITDEDPLITPQRAEPFFGGAVCVLIGPRTFSSASDMADGMKTYHLATLIGQETGGRPNTFGEAYFFRLPRSGLAVSVSSARFVRANGDSTDHRGVLPDIVVRPTSADRQSGRDAVLERARECPRL